jgi:hypothetical protein
VPCRIAGGDDRVQDAAGALGQRADPDRERRFCRRCCAATRRLHTKIEAWYHLTANLSYPLMIVLSVLMLPAMIIRFYQGWFQMLFIDLPLFMASTFSISSFYLVSQRELFPKSWPKALLYLPFLMALGIGLTITNTKAVIEALIGKESAFARTPKYHVESKKDKVRRYQVSQAPGLGAVARTADRQLLCADGVLCDRERELRYDSIPAAVRGGLLVYRIDVSAARAFSGVALSAESHTKPFPVGV